MALVKFQTEHFRNLASDSLSFSPSFNLIYGENGSGKSSLLEAIAYLGLGRSFRVNRHKAVVRHGENRFTVFGGLQGGGSESGGDHRLGISRDIGTDETRLRIDGETVRSLSRLAVHLPISVIDPGVFDIASGGPGNRRQFLDWLVFHVEPSFGPLWQQCQKATSQRNQMLRNGRLDEQLLKVWDQQYCDLAERVTHHRKATFERFSAFFNALIDEVSPPWADGLTARFFGGWDDSVALQDLLASHREQEIKAGHTLYGPNRADIRLKYRGRPVAETFSRGQQKTLVILMKIAQGALLRDIGKQVTFLLDDINAELDVAHRGMLASRLSAMESQVFLTSIEKPDPVELWGQQVPEYKMFHVEHGHLTEVQPTAL